MGSESSTSESNNPQPYSIASNSINSLNNTIMVEDLGTMDFEPSNSNTTIKRVWIVKKPISLTDGHIVIDTSKYTLFLENVPQLLKSKKNIFNIKNEWNTHIKHWAIILELSNDSYVNIQYGNIGISLKEFNKTQIEGENILNAILNTWGEKDTPLSFCYLGETSYDYEKLKKILIEKKDKEIKKVEEYGSLFYNIFSFNCQDFSKDIEIIIFKKMKTIHFFKFYLDAFFNEFFPNKNINKLKLMIDENNKKKNKEILEKNKKILEEYKQKMGKYERHKNLIYLKLEKELKKEFKD